MIPRHLNTIPPVFTYLSLTLNSKLLVSTFLTPSPFSRVRSASVSVPPTRTARARKKSACVMAHAECPASSRVSSAILFHQPNLAFSFLRTFMLTFTVTVWCNKFHNFSGSEILYIPSSDGKEVEHSTIGTPNPGKP